MNKQETTLVKQSISSTGAQRLCILVTAPLPSYSLFPSGKQGKRLQPSKCKKRNENCTNRHNSSFSILGNCSCLLTFTAKSFLPLDTLQMTEKCQYRFAPPLTTLFTGSMNRELWTISPEGENNRIFWAIALKPPKIYSQPTLLFLTVKE